MSFRRPSRLKGKVMTAALIIIDMQKFVIDRVNNGIEMYPDNAIHNMESILNKFRCAGSPVIHIRHHTREEGSLLHPTSPLAQVIEGFEEEQGEPVLIKNTSSAFSSTDLFSHLKNHHIDECVVIGAVAGFCVNSTVRAGADLGLKMTVVKDAVISFALEELNLEAKTIFDVTLGLLAADFAKIVTTKEMI